MTGSASRNSIWIGGLVAFALVMFPASLFAATEVVFSDADLGAFVQLVKPELTSLRLDGRQGSFRPGPALRFAGLENQDFDIDLNLGANLVDLRFNDLRAKAPALAFEADRVRIEIAFDDQAKAIKSALGAIGLKGVVLAAWAKFDANGRLVYDSASLAGELKGTGLLKPKWVIDAVRSLAMKAMKSEIERQLGREGVQASIAAGLLNWAKFSSDPRFTRVVPDSVKVTPTALRFEAE
ncbi:MAG: hypothetical protein JST04_09365 [Bdellovibrionales bacterium]|nr:hypothetical protein [Bdellovibrionales bacterium]